MKVKLLIARDDCEAGDVVSFGDRAARAIIASKQAVAWEEPPAVEKPVKSKARKPEPAKAPENKEQ